MRVSDIMVTNPVMVSPETPVNEVAQLMKYRSVGSVILVKNNKPVGVVTERDLVRRVLAPGVTPKSLTAWALLCVAFALAMQILSGHPQMTFYTVVFATVWVAMLGKGVSATLKWALAVAMAAGLCAAQLLPTMELVRESSRGTLTFEQATEFSFSFGGLLGLVLPEFFGTHAEGTFWNSWYYWSSGYVTTAMALLAVFAVLPGRLEHSVPRRAVFSLAGIVLLSLFLAMGRQNPAYRIVFQLPGFSSFRAPAKFLPFAVMGLCLLGGIGADRLFQLIEAQAKVERLQRLRRMGLFAAVIIVCSLIVWPFRAVSPLQAGDSKQLAALSRSLSATGLYLLCGIVILWGGWRGFWPHVTTRALLALLLFSDLYNYGAKYQTFSEPSRMYTQTPEIRFLQSDRDVFRVATMKDVYAFSETENGPTTLDLPSFP